jgi:hypothetical protein
VIRTPPAHLLGAANPQLADPISYDVDVPSHQHRSKVTAVLRSPLAMRYQHWQLQHQQVVQWMERMQLRSSRWIHSMW